jgi:hypothetical protein
MDWVLNILGSAGFGSALGGIFGFLAKREERANLQMKLDHDINLIKAKTEASITIAKMGVETAKVSGQLLVDKVEAKAFEVSQKSSGVLADNLKAFIRPIILGILMYQTYMILKSLEELTGGLASFSPDEVLGLYRIVMLSVTGLTATAVGWYFASRSSKQFDKLLEKFN